MKKNRRGFIGLAVILLVGAVSFSRPAAGQEPPAPAVTRGVWVTVFSGRQVLYSEKAARELLDFCGRAGVTEVYLQIYQSGQAYYDSALADRTKYEEILKAAGKDPVDFLLAEAAKRKIGIHAWINVLSVGKNKQANPIVPAGEGVLTRDQYLRSSLRGELGNETDKYYLRDDQIFLEPGDPRVVEHAAAIVGEILTRYPGWSGIHLDYIRYPYPVPYLPNSRFLRFGLSYGYGEKNLAAFREKTGLDPLALKAETGDYLRWDDWKREQVTALVEKLAGIARKKSPALTVSCAVLPTLERAYAAAFQDWPMWLERGIVDGVVLMNYTIDSRLAEEVARSALALRGRGKIKIGIGAYLWKTDPEGLAGQYRRLAVLNPDGIVFFSYDDVNDREGKIAGALFPPPPVPPK